MDSRSNSTVSTLSAISEEKQLALWSRAGSELSMGLIVVSADGTKFRVDEKVESLFAVKSSGEQPILVFQNWLADESSETFSRLQESLAADTPFDGVLASRQRPGIWVRIVGASRGSGTERGFLVWDRTEQVLNESRLAADRHFFETVLNSFSDPVTIIDSDFRFIYGNTAFSSLIGLIPEEYYGRSMVELGLVNARAFHENDRRCLHGHVEVESEEALNFGDASGSKGSQEQLWLVKRVPYSAPNGRTTVVSVFRDIREVRRMQLELDRSRARSSQISRLKGLATLAAGVAHELNNPLMIVSGAVEAIRDQLEDCSSRSRVESLLIRAARGVQRAAEIVQAMQKMGANTMSTDGAQSEVELISVIGSARLLLSTELTRNAVEIRVSGLPSARVLGSESALIRVVTALVQNAIEAISTAGGPTRIVSIDVGRVADAAKFELIVEDSGPGISTAHQDQIFEPFYSTKEIGQGLGLGLSLAKEAVEAMGGHVEYVGTSALGGARFHIELKAFGGLNST
ncbi:MAG: PAS domain-containing sensor histidine kinase [Bdellovibrionaceae bacterium]|nr:PAS domain-containing sensor histidine kinase [Pseudobdellovibrionaceae bacterium]